MHINTYRVDAQAVGVAHAEWVVFVGEDDEVRNGIKS